MLIILILLKKFWIQIISAPSYNLKKKGPLGNIPPLLFIFICLSLIFFLYQIIGGGIAYFMLGSDVTIQEDNLNLTRIILTFGQFMFILFPAVMLAILQDNDIKSTFNMYTPDTRVLIFSIAGILIIQPFLQALLYYQNELIFNLPVGKEVITQLKELFDAMESATSKLVEARSVPEFLLVMIVIAVTPAICEEFLFRGLIFKNFQKIIPASKAIFFTGLLFALFHFHPFNIIPLTILGVFLTFVTYHSGSIYTAIICHFLNNFISALAVFTLGIDSFEKSDVKMTSDEQLQFLILGIISFAAFVSIVILIKKYSVKKHSDITAPPPIA